MDQAPPCPKCGGKLKVSGQRRTPTFSYEACGWTSDLRLSRVRRVIEMAGVLLAFRGLDGAAQGRN